jgi:uncharacterized protein (DUF924 family)
MNITKRSRDIIAFWFAQTPPEKRFAKDPQLDKEITRHFRACYETMVADPEPWLAQVQSCFAAIIVLDQFARNMFRGDKQSFAADPIALRMAQLMIEKGWIDDLPEDQRNFVLLPFMHSEDASIHSWALPYFERYSNAATMQAEHDHKAIVDRFGRYPHRNAVLGRTSSDEETAFLKENPGF